MPKMSKAEHLALLKEAIDATAFHDSHDCHEFHPLHT
jgi:hypothetical protein